MTIRPRVLITTLSATLQLFASTPAHSMAPACRDLFTPVSVEVIPGPGSWSASKAINMLRQLDPERRNKLLFNENFWLKLFLTSSAKKFSPARLNELKNYDDAIQSLFARMKFVEYGTDTRAAIIRSFSTEGRFHSWVNRQLLSRGLRGFVEAQGLSANPSALQKLYDPVARLFKNPIVQALFKMQMPKRTDHQIPDDLLAKVLVDGADAHIAELNQHFGAQSRIDLYRKVAAPINFFSYALGIYLMVQALSDLDQAQHEQQDRAIDDLIKTIDALNQNLEKKQSDEQP